MAKLPTVRDYMDTDVPTLRPETPMLEAVGFLLEKRVTGAPVVNDAGELVGIVTEYDCLHLLALGAGGEAPAGTVGDYMTAAVTTVPPRMNVYFAAGMFLNARVRRFPVVEEGRLVGAVTRYDILRAVRAQMD